MLKRGAAPRTKTAAAPADVKEKILRRIAELVTITLLRHCFDRTLCYNAGDAPQEFRLRIGQSSYCYARMKSRPSFRALLSEAVPGIRPSATYADLDF